MNKKGFTLIELLAVIVVLAIILAIAVPAISSLISNATSNSVVSDAKLLLKQMNLLKLNNSGFDFSTVTVETLSDYNISDKNYEYVAFGEINTQIYALIIGREKWDGYVICGTVQDLKVYQVGDIFVCNSPIDFKYTGDAQTFTAPLTGNYKVELWGAEGGFGSSTFVGVQLINQGIFQGGKGAYAVGYISLTKNTPLYVHVGGKGFDHPKGLNSVVEAGYNGGGTGANDSVNRDTFGGAGGGATDIRLISGAWNDSTGLKSRIMVAGGGGGGAIVRTNHIYDSNIRCGNGTMAGGLSINGTISNYSSGYLTPAAVGQTTGNAFGVGGNGFVGDEAGGGGGGGYYGGTIKGDTHSMAGSGGSSFISGYAGCDAADASGVHTGQPNHYSGYIFTSAQMIAGNASMPSPSGVAEVGHIGHGYARFTYLGNG